MPLNPVAPFIRGGTIGLLPSPGTTQNVALPAQGQPGDVILIWCVGVAPSTTWSSPGFTAVAPVAGTAGNGSSQLLWKPNVGDLAGTTYVVTSSRSDVWGSAILSVGNQEQTLEFDGAVSSGLISASTTTQVTAPGLTLTYPDDLLVWLGFTLVPSGTPVLTPPSGFTAALPQAYGSIAGSTNVSIMVAYSQGPATANSGATGQKIGTVSSAEITGGAFLAFPLPILTKNYVRPSQRAKHGQAFQSLFRRRRTIQIIAQTGTQFPLVIGRAFRGIVPVQKFRTRTYNPVAAQAQLTQPFPTVTRQQRRSTAGAVLQLARIPRYRQQPSAPPPQGPLAPNWVAQLRQPRASRFVPSIRRLRGGQVPLGQTPKPLPFNPFVRRRDPASAQVLKLPRHRGSFFLQMPQGPLPQGNPAVLSARARRRPWALYRRHKAFSLPTPKQTQQARAHWTQGSALAVTPLVTNQGRASWTQSSRMNLVATDTRFATLHWTAGSGWRLIAKGTHFAQGSWTAASQMHTAAFKIRHGSASFTQASSISIAASRGRGAVWTQGSAMGLTATVSHPAAAAWSQASVMVLIPATSPYRQEILIPPLAIPGVNRPGLAAPVTSPAPVTEAVIRAQVEDELFDQT